MGICVKINNEQDYDKMKHLLRNPSMPYSQYLSGRYMESTHRGWGFISEPKDTWTKEQLKVLSVEEYLEM